MSETPKWHFGNAAVDGAERRGWLVGAFLDPDDVHRVHGSGDQVGRSRGW